LAEVHKMTAEWAKDFAAEWIESWNSHDLDRILAHYAESVEFFSPFVSQMLGEPDGRICGKSALRAYFAKALGAYPNLRFDLYTVLSGVNSLTIFYRSVKNLLAAEVMLFDDGHRVTLVFAHYGNDDRQFAPLGPQSN
jgi:hypothetical protein